MVSLIKQDGVLSFGHGWKNFVVDNDISVGEFLVFRQIARSVFTMQIFALSACERIHLCERNNRQSRKRKPRRQTGYPANQMVEGIPVNHWRGPGGDEIGAKETWWQQIHGN
ncbi:hypothetical protein E2562_036417 [Oryza meyeriana var. granulata]|uniref:TF-B3 domain-containing protein n=1 Tax=Oryza meyeriana var. granulata TaxID=110450 RepID=A0A6G1E819_9ORYZ|nr:hypothetical protein E2562_036417 [Oryza meyeriana var. granulata]